LEEEGWSMSLTGLIFPFLASFLATFLAVYKFSKMEK
jgi:hypothetical protein